MSHSNNAYIAVKSFHSTLVVGVTIMHLHALVAAWPCNWPRIAVIVQHQHILSTALFRLAWMAFLSVTHGDLRLGHFCSPNIFTHACIWVCSIIFNSWYVRMTLMVGQWTWRNIHVLSNCAWTFLLLINRFWFFISIKSTNNKADWWKNNTGRTSLGNKLVNHVHEI